MPPKKAAATRAAPTRAASTRAASAKPDAKSSTTKPATKSSTKPATKSSDKPATKISTKSTTKDSTKPAVSKTTKAELTVARRGRPKKMAADTTVKTSAKETTKTRKTTTTTTTSKKRKADTDEEKPRDPKKPRVIAQPRAPKPKAVKPKVAINEPPKTRLNVFVCGEGSSGELGLGTAKNVIDVKRPRLNQLLAADKVGVVQIAVGGMHCVALTYDNQILTWGVNDQGALGRETAWEGALKDVDADSDSDSDDEDSGLNPRESTPTAIPTDAFPEGTVFVKVVAADSASFALTDDGLVYGWGTFRVSLTFTRSCRSY